MPPDRDLISVERTCPVCGSDQHRLWRRKGVFSIVRCARCGMLFVNPVERSFADGRFYDERAEAYYLSPDKLTGDYAPVRFERELRLFRRFCSRGEVLDVGCSTGGFLHQLATRYPGDYCTLGTDVSGAALDYAASRSVPVRRGWFLDIDFDDQFFDAITFWAVLEHLADPAPFLCRAATLLKPGGHVFALVPNMKSLAARLLGMRYRYVCAEHLNYFTAPALLQLAKEAGPFEVAEMRTTHLNPVVLWQDFRSQGGTATDAARAQLLRRTNRWKQHPLLGPARLAYSWAEKILGTLHLADNLAVVLRKANSKYGTET